MKRLREKSNSQRGATLVLALLFLLLCMMVASSVLMAAASNGGRIRSNYEEQQKYLALSSALRVVSDQIREAKYTGNYTAYQWEEPVYNEKGDIIDTIYYFQVCQTEGEFECGALTGVSSNTVLDFLKELDGLYAKEFTASGYKALAGASAAFPVRRTLSVTVGSEGDEIRKKFPPVDVKVQMEADCRIHLTATLTEIAPDPEGGDPGKVYQLEGELSAEGSPVVEYSPENRIPGTMPETGVTVRERGDIDAFSGGPDVIWKLEWIDKEVAGG